MKLEKKVILVVDDQIGIQLLLKDTLIEKGYDVLVAGTGQEALDMISSRQIDLLLLDYQLPILNGREVMGEIEEQNLQIPVIVMSGLPEHLHFENDTFSFLIKKIAKPFNIEEMYSLVEEVVYI